MESQARRLSGDGGATMVEYALMVARIAAVTLIGTNSRNKFSTVGNSIGSAS